MCLLNERPGVFLHVSLSDCAQAIVLRCLLKTPDDRFLDAHSLGKALATCGCADGWAEQDAASWWHAHGETNSGAAQGLRRAAHRVAAQERVQLTARQSEQTGGV
jgi:hypothetical protein